MKNQPLRPTPLTNQPLSSLRGSYREVMTTRCCMSRHVRSGFASKARAHIPAANGAEALVPGIPDH